MHRALSSLPPLWWQLPPILLTSHVLFQLGWRLDAQFSLWLISALPVALLYRRRKRRQQQRGVLLACEFMVDPTVESLRQRALELKLGQPELDGDS